MNHRERRRRVLLAVERPQKAAVDTEDLEALTVDELRDLAKSAGISGYWTMRKAELVEALEAEA